MSVSSRLSAKEYRLRKNLDIRFYRDLFIHTYLLGRAGVTGAETAATIPASELIAKLTQYKVAPPLLGFGISKPEQVKEAISAGAAGAISGSATVNIIAENLSQPEVMLSKLRDFVSAMKQATKK